jgi:purine-nucleoside/S-methyl-5'-thioadenosine phosphorylase / adenosine deaminase
VEVLGAALGPARVRWTGRAHGHLGRPRPGIDTDGDIDQRRQTVQPGRWSWLAQVHGGDVVVVASPGEHAGRPADALVTATPGVVLAVFTADCAPVALSSSEGVIGLVHAGWRGLAGGVVENAVAVMREHGATAITAALGPCIRAGCYEFGAGDLAQMAEQFGPGVCTTTAWGTPGLDLAAGVAVALGRAGAELALDAGACTACSAAWYSHRARQDSARQATLAWVP